MRFMVRVLSWLVLAAGCYAQADLGKVLGFETEQPGGIPKGWTGVPAGTIFTDDKVVHGGQWSVRLERKSDSADTFTALTKSLPLDFTGNTIELRGWVKTEEVKGKAALWLREDGDSGPVAFDNMAGQQLEGTNGWTQHSIKLPLRTDAKKLFFGFLLSGTGKAWADDLELLVDGKPVWEALKSERAKTPLDLDHEFDSGSRVSFSELTKVQAENLALLGRVWGFLKYHHPEITNGKRHWDYDLFRAMPAVLAAKDHAGSTLAMDKWIAGLGEIPACNPCATLEESELHLRPEVDWIRDEALLGKDLSAKLVKIFTNRHAGGKQFHVSLAPGVGNPVFEGELAYTQLKLPDSGFQLLAAYRFWNIVKYWFPYRDVIGEDWDGVLTEFIPRIALAKTRSEYELELMAMIARVHDTHANLWSSIAVRPPAGECIVPVVIRFIEGQPTVTGTLAPDTGFQAGDVVTELDGKPVSELVERWKPYYAASNEPTQLRDIGRSLTQGACGEATARVRRENETLTLKTQRVKVDAEKMRAAWRHDLPGETFQILPENVAYLKLSSVKASDAAKYVKEAAATKGLIIDIRNYPAEFMVFALGSLLVEKETPFARIAVCDPRNPGAFHWARLARISPAEPHYAGKLAILADEVSQSSAEYTAMAFRAAPGAMVIGSTTAAADGNVSAIPLPAGLRSMISGIGIFYPDKRPTQRVGIVPDVLVKPTLAGVRAGKDEVLEEALRRILMP